MNASSCSKTMVSVVVPVFNGAEVWHHFHDRVTAVLTRMGVAAEIIYVNDGCSDLAFSGMQRLYSSHAPVAIVNLSRNFGKEIAVTAGKDYVNGDAVVIIDADLQDPPEVI